MLYLHFWPDCDVRQTRSVLPRLFSATDRRRAVKSVKSVRSTGIMRAERTSKAGSYLFRTTRAIAQAVSNRFPIPVARVPVQVCSCEICGGQRGTEAGFFQVLWLPLPILIRPIAPQSPQSIICVLYSRPILAAVPSGLSLTPLIIIIMTNTYTAFITLFKAIMLFRAVFTAVTMSTLLPRFLES
jgi:hypothetical protein